MTSMWEPGLLTVFRGFVAARLGLAAMLVLLRVALWPVETQALATLLQADAVGVVVLAIVAFIPGLERRLGRIYLLLLIALATVGPLVAQRLALGSADWSAAPTPLAQGWHLIPLLLAPLVAIAAQYGMRSVAVYCLATMALDFGLVATAVGRQGAEPGPLVAMLFVRTLAFAVVGWLVVIVMSRQRAQRAALAEANRRLAHYASVIDQLATSRERNRLARELHDTIAHTLSGVAVQLEALRAVWPTDQAAARVILDESLAATRGGLANVRAALQALRVEPLADLGLALALTAEAQALAQRAGFALDLDVGADVGALPEAVEHTVYRVAQEALENVARHAQASRVAVGLRRTGPDLTLMVRDDGLGFDPTTASADRYGLLGMHERCAAVGARLEVESRPGAGTLVRLEWRGEP